MMNFGDALSELKLGKGWREKVGTEKICSSYYIKVSARLMILTLK